MATFTVTTPVPGHSGKVGDITFVDGSAVIDEDANPSELAYCRGAGYGVAEVGHTDEPDDDAVRAELEALEVKVDPRWKTKRLVAELDKARAAAAETDDDSTDDEPDGEPGNDEENDQP